MSLLYDLFTKRKSWAWNNRVLVGKEKDPISQPEKRAQARVESEYLSTRFTEPERQAGVASAKEMI